MAQGHNSTWCMLDDKIVDRSPHQLINSAFVGDPHHDHVAVDIAGRFADLRTRISYTEHSFDGDVVRMQFVKLFPQSLVERRMLVNAPAGIGHVADMQDHQLCAT